MKRIVLFQVGGQNYGLDSLAAKGIENHGSLISAPGAPEKFKGIAVIRGELIPVYSLRKKFHFGEAPVTLDTKLIIGRSKGMTVAYAVDKVLGIQEVPEENFSQAPIMVRSDDTAYIESILDVGQGLAIYLNQDGILTKEEKENMEPILAELKKNKEEEEKRIQEEKRKAREERIKQLEESRKKKL